MKIERRAFFGAMAATALPLAAQAQDVTWPTKPVRVIVPYAASGGTDILVRAIGEALRNTLPQPFIVENRAGAAGVIGSEVVARAEPDGHTLLVVVSTHVMNKYHLPSMPYDAIRDFTPIAMLTRNTMVLVAGANQPFDSLSSMLAYAKANPGKVGTGSTEALSSFIGQEMARRAGVEMPDIAYRSGGPLMNDIVAGHLPSGWFRPARVHPSSRMRQRPPNRACAILIFPAGLPCWDRRAWRPLWWTAFTAPSVQFSPMRPSSKG
jgi:tripartite-type tricarboxylate transporter receptor subunit TctC